MFAIHQLVYTASQQANFYMLLISDNMYFQFTLFYMIIKHQICGRRQTRKEEAGRGSRQAWKGNWDEEKHFRLDQQMQLELDVENAL